MSVLSLKCYINQETQSYRSKILVVYSALLHVSAKTRTSCRSVFQQFDILPLLYQYVLSLMNFIVSNQENFQTNSAVHIINTINKHHLHRPNARLSCFQKSTFYAGIKIFHSIPPSLTRQNSKQP